MERTCFRAGSNISSVSSLPTRLCLEGWSPMYFITGTQRSGNSYVHYNVFVQQNSSQYQYQSYLQSLHNTLLVSMGWQAQELSWIKNLQLTLIEQACVLTMQDSLLADTARHWQSKSVNTFPQHTRLKESLKQTVTTGRCQVFITISG